MLTLYCGGGHLYFSIKYYPHLKADSWDRFFFMFMHIEIYKYSNLATSVEGHYLEDASTFV